jgi:hypothetical protein
MTLIVSALGVAGRFAGDLLSSALGWASNLLFGRVPRDHQRYVLLMMAASVLWVIALLGVVIPAVTAFYLASTPRPSSINDQLIESLLLAGALGLPLVVGAAGYLVPADGSRPAPLGLLVEMARGYILAPLLVALLVFLAGVGLVRKARSRRHGWSDAHVAIVSETSGYDELVADLVDGLRTAGLDAEAHDAPRILSVPGWVLTRVSGENVRRLRPARLIEIAGRNLRVGVYPSDIAISGAIRTRVRARAAIVARLVASPAHLTTTAEGQRIEDDLRAIAERHGRSGRQARDSIGRAFATIDEQLLDVDVPTEEWDLLYRLRLQAERDLLIGSEPGTAFPGARSVDRDATAEPEGQAPDATTSGRRLDGPGRRPRTSPDPSR